MNYELIVIKENTMNTKFYTFNEDSNFIPQILKLR